MTNEKYEGGYSGHSMSNRAINAYSAGQMPYSKWTKQNIIEGIQEYAEANDIDIKSLGIERLTARELKNIFLEYAAWHHTGKFYSATDFYELRAEKIEDLSKEEIDAIIQSRKTRNLSEEERRERRENKENLESAKDLYRHLEIIFYSGITNLKTFQGVIDRFTSGRMNLAAAYQEALEAIKKTSAPKVEQWSKLPKDHWRQNFVCAYNNDIEKYANMLFCKTDLDHKGNLHTLQQLKKYIADQRAKEETATKEEDV